MNLKDFYNKFHKYSKPQEKIINRYNFTYTKIVEIIDLLTKDKANISILDFGCGVGTIDLYLSSKGYKVDGTDISTFAIDNAKKSSIKLGLQNNAKFTELNEYKKLVPKKYDIIICTEVLEHISDDLGVLKMLKKRLKSKGKILISVPSNKAPLYRLGLTNSFDKDVGHLRRYDEESILRLINKSKLVPNKILKTEGIIRNSLFVIKHFGFLVKFIRGPLTPVIQYIDQLSVIFFGESDIFVISTNA